MSRARNLALIPVLAAVLLALNACAIAGVRTQVKQIDSVSVYRGEATREAPSKSPLMVVLWSPAASAIVTYDVLLFDGPYYLVAKPGEYRVIAFEDRNRNFIYDGGEQVGELAGAPVDTHVDPAALGKISVSSSKLHSVPPLDLSATGLPAALQRRAENLGRVVTLDEPMFAAGDAVMGLWKPADFLKQGRTGIYALEPYDANKIPVLFVHGIGGSPREFRSIADGLDRSRFQPLFFHYPSGFSLEFNGWLLAQLLEEMRLRHGFQRMILVAHSMGGLVAASCLDWRAADGHAPLFDLVVTISTPWLGNAYAATAPSGFSMPSWKDISPGSDFLKRLASLRSIDKAEYLLFFSMSGDSRLMSGADDGTVTIASQLPYAAQNASSFLYGFSESHASVLENQLLISMIRTAAANKADGKPAATGLKELARKQ